MATKKEADKAKILQRRIAEAKLRENGVESKAKAYPNEIKRQERDAFLLMHQEEVEAIRLRQDTIRLKQEAIRLKLEAKELKQQEAFRLKRREEAEAIMLKQQEAETIRIKQQEEKRKKEAEANALKQRYRESMINFNFDNLYIIGEKEKTDKPNIMNYTLRCSQNELEEIYTSVWDNEEALIKWKNANLVEDEHCAIDFLSFASLILTNTEIKWALLNPPPEVTDYEIAESIGIDKMMLLSANGVWPLLEHRFSTNGQANHITMMLKQSALENLNMTPNQFISNVDKLMEEQTSSLLFTTRSHVEQFENDLKLEHLELNEILCFDGDREEIAKGKIDFFGHCFQLTYGIYNKVINGVYDYTKVLKFELTDDLKSNYDKSLDLHGVLLDQPAATLTVYKKYSGALNIELNNHENWATFFIILSQENIEKLTEHFRKINQITVFLLDSYITHVNSIVSMLLEDSELVEIGKNFINESSNNFYTDVGCLLLVEALIDDNSYCSWGKPMLLSSKERRDAYFSENQGAMYAIRDIVCTYLVENLEIFADFLKEKTVISDRGQNIFITYIFIYNLAIEYLGQKWENEYKQYFQDIIELNLDEAIERYCSIDTVVHRDNVALGKFVYYLIKHGKFDKNNRNYVSCLYDIIPKLNQILENKKYNNFVNRLKTANTNSQRKYSLNDVDLMDGLEFEKFIAELFSKMGYESEITKASGDQGIDVIASKNGNKIGIQAKCYSSSVGNSAIQEAVAGKSYYRLDKAIVVTNNFFTDPAQQLAQSNSIILWDRHILKEKIDEVFNSSLD